MTVYVCICLCMCVYVCACVYMTVHVCDLDPTVYVCILEHREKRIAYECVCVCVYHTPKIEGCT